MAGCYLVTQPNPNYHQPCRFSRSGRIPGWPWEVIEFYDDVEPYYISLNTFATKLHIATLKSQRFAFYHSSVEILPPMLEMPPKLGVSPPMFAILLPPLVGVLPPICNKIAEEEEHCVMANHHAQKIFPTCPIHISALSNTYCASLTQYASLPTSLSN